jgi:hypothetical protein
MLMLYISYVDDQRKLGANCSGARRAIRTSGAKLVRGDQRPVREAFLLA